MQWQPYCARTPTTQLHQSDKANQYLGIIRSPWWTEVTGQIWLRCQGYSPTLSKDIQGFLKTTESQDLGLTSHPKNGALWQYSVPVTILRPTQVAPLQAPLTPLPAVTWFSQKVSHPGTNQPQPCLALVGNQSWARGWYGCGLFIGTKWTFPQKWGDERKNLSSGQTESDSNHCDKQLCLYYF